jgi:hypothetical protein
MIVGMSAWCCAEMQRQVTRRCDQHPDPFDCPDSVVSFNPKFREHGLIIHDGGGAVYGIAFCPWCGSRLPESLRDRWFDELERRGIDNPDDAPPDMLTDAWLDS